MNVKVVEEREASRSIVWGLASVELVPVTEAGNIGLFVLIKYLHLKGNESLL